MSLQKLLRLGQLMILKSGRQYIHPIKLLGGYICVTIKYHLRYVSDT